MAGVVPDAGTCDSCGIELDEEDGYLILDDDGAIHRYCDDCPPEQPEAPA